MMAATIQVGRWTATIGDEMRWLSDFKPLEQALNINMIGYEVSGADPNPPLTAARITAEKYNGTVTQYDKSDREVDVVY